MSIRLNHPARLVARAAAAVVLAAGLAVASTATVRAAPARPTATAPLSVIPALHNWSPATGSVTLGADSRIVTDAPSAATARQLAGALHAARGWHTPVVRGPAHPADIVLHTRADRHDLGTEGYALRIGDTVEITGATTAGTFYGTRTLLQMLTAGTTLPAGATTDVPTYRERAVGVCACYTYHTTAWFDRLLKDMAYLKLNTLHVELKMASRRYPKINNFSYYEPDQLRRLADTAARYHIQIIPEINSPGHMDPYLTNYPDLQLVGSDGKADPTRLDVTKPAAFTFYTNLIGDEMRVLPGKYWHMGADEYMIGSAYSHYPQLLAYARAKYGPDATAQDAFIDFINRVDDYVRAHGRTLRIWNDGLTGDNTVPLNSDIVVEHWIGEKVTPQQLLDAGHQVMNASYAFYYVRGGHHPDAKSLYESGWSPRDFEGQTVAAGQPGLTGGELMVWPDNYGAETENRTQQGLFAPLRVFAQATWGSPHPSADYTEFAAHATAIGHAPGYGPGWTQPLPDGTYRISRRGADLAAPDHATGSGLVVDRAATGTWTLHRTSDGYYRLTSVDSGLCADIAHGTRNRLGVIEQEGAPASQETCGSATTQKWQVEAVPGGYRIVDATTQQALTVTGSGAVVQQPRQLATAGTWRIDAA